MTTNTPETIEQLTLRICQEDGSFNFSRDLRFATRIAAELSAQHQVEIAAGIEQPLPAHCEYCDDTGDVHNIEGEWLGTCNCGAASQLEKALGAENLILSAEQIARHVLVTEFSWVKDTTRQCRRDDVVAYALAVVAEVDKFRGDK